MQRILVTFKDIEGDKEINSLLCYNEKTANLEYNTSLSWKPAENEDLGLLGRIAGTFFNSLTAGQNVTADENEQPIDTLNSDSGESSIRD